MDRPTEVLRLVEELFPPESPGEGRSGYANFLNVEPSFLKDTNGQRARLSIWIPALPLAIDVEPRRHRTDYVARSQQLSRMDCPYILVGAQEALTMGYLIATLRRLTYACSPGRCDRINSLLTAYEDSHADG